MASLNTSHFDPNSPNASHSDPNDSTWSPSRCPGGAPPPGVGRLRLLRSQCRDGCPQGEGIHFTTRLSPSRSKSKRRRRSRLRDSSLASRTLEDASYISDDDTSCHVNGNSLPLCNGKSQIDGNCKVNGTPQLNGNSIQAVATKSYLDIIRDKLFNDSLLRSLTKQSLLFDEFKKIFPTSTPITHIDMKNRKSEKEIATTIRRNEKDAKMNNVETNTRESPSTRRRLFSSEEEEEVERGSSTTTSQFIQERSTANGGVYKMGEGGNSSPESGYEGGTTATDSDSSARIDLDSSFEEQNNKWDTPRKIAASTRRLSMIAPLNPYIAYTSLCELLKWW